MASPNCWRCLLRPSMASPSPRPTPTSYLGAWNTTAPPTTSKTNMTPSMAARPFSTTTSAQAIAGTSRPQAGVHQRIGKRMKLAKFKSKKEIIRPKAPLPGERKKWRKRVVLSNNNAIPVNGLSVMDEKNLANPESAGNVLKIPGFTIDQLRASEAFKSNQTWGMFHSPHTLVRPETVTVCRRMLEDAAEKRTARLVVAGEKTAGKSIVLIQAMANAFLNDWVVILIPEAQELTTARTDYAPIPDTNPQQWMQSHYALNLMKRILTANRAVLDRIYTTRSYEDFTNPVAEGATLVTLIESAREPDQAWPVFTALWYELTSVKADADGTSRPPLLFALDGLHSVMGVSAYRNQSFEPIHSHDLAIVRMFVDILSGHHVLPNGGAAIAATARSNAARNPSMELAVARQLARQAGAEELPPRDPYNGAYDARVDAALEDTGIQAVDVQGITKAEARALMEYWAASGLLRAEVDERTVSDKWMVGGNGIIGEMERAGLLTLRL